MPNSPAISVSARNTSLWTNDFDELAQSFPAWNATIRQMSGGRFSGSLSGVRIGSVSVSRITTSHSVQVRGVLRRPGYLFTPVTVGNSRAVWRGRSLNCGQINFVGPETIIDHLSTSGTDSSLISIDPIRLRETGGTLAHMDLEEYLRGRLAIGSMPAEFTQLCTRMSELLSEPPTESEHADTEAELIGLLVKSLVSNDPTLEEIPPIHGRQRIVRRAEEFMLANLAQPVAILDICRELDVSERTLQYAFRDRFGMTPKAYLKAHRLNAVRGALKAANPKFATVHEVAARWGFRHTGEFAADYRQHFGELPSETLADG